MKRPTLVAVAVLAAWAMAGCSNNEPLSPGLIASGKAGAACMFINDAMKAALDHTDTNKHAQDAIGTAADAASTDPRWQHFAFDVQAAMTGDQQALSRVVDICQKWSADASQFLTSTPDPG